MASKIRWNPNQFIRIRNLPQERLKQFTAALFLEGAVRIIMRTPVKSGRARGNWDYTFDEPSDYRNWDDKDPSGETAQYEAIDFSKLIDGKRLIFVVNNLPYIRRLEYGWSKQAPQGMVRVTVAELHGLAEEIALQLQEQSNGK